MSSRDNQALSYEYIRGLVDGEGTFTFSTTMTNGIKRKIPVFSIKMHVRDKMLIEMIKNTLKLKNKVYVYNHQKKDGYMRGPQAMLIVREIGALKNIVIPLFYKKLKGNKGKQFNEWIEIIGNDPDVPRSYKFIYFLYKSGFYDQKTLYIKDE